MKRIVSVILSAIIIILSVSQGFCAFAQVNEYNKLSNFAEQLSDMVRESEAILDSTIEKEIKNEIEGVIASVDKFYSGFSETECDESDDTFATQRLIVKSEKAIDYQGAIDCVSGYNNLYILQYNSVVETKRAYNYYLECDYIDYVEPDIIMSAQDDIDVPDMDISEEEISDFDEVTADAIEWLSDKIGFNDIKDELSERVNDDYVLVAVLDSGVDTDHEFFENRLVESDYNGSSSGERGSVEDDYGHGTHVAGIIAGNTLDNVKIKPYKVLNDMGNGSLSSISVAVDLAVADGADVINMSLTARNKSERMTEAVNNAVANDVNVVVAAGNNSYDLDNVYVTPACIDSAITVSATDNNDNLASFSNFDGPIDIAAPGKNIKSCYLDNTYTSMSGTSMSAPQVTAGLAILQTVFEDKPANECEEMIKEYAIAMFEKEGENHFGAGLLFLKYLLDGKPTTADPVFSIDSCDFSSAFNVSISCPDDNVRIFYIMYDTGDLDAVNWFDSFEYSSPITIKMDTKVSAIAIASGKNPSSIVTVEYNRVSENEEGYYEINSRGLITGYYGDLEDLDVPAKIKGKTVKGIATNGLKDNAKIKTITLPDTADKIYTNAFSGCKNLEAISGNGIVEIGASAFRDCVNLTDVDLPNLKIVGEYGFSGSGLTEVDFPSVETIGIRAFDSCQKLVSASLPAITSVTVGAFNNCTSLKTIDISSATEIYSDGFRNTGIEKIKLENVEVVANYAFADNPNLKAISLPDATIAGAYLFHNCTALEMVSLPKLEKANSYLFNNCTALKAVYLPAVTSVLKNAFAGSSIGYLKFDCVETIKSLPSNLSTIVLPSTLVEISGTVPTTDFTVYGYNGTYAEKFANDNNKEFCSIPAIVYDLTDEVNAEDGYILVYALGFNCTYQWYKNDSLSNENGTLIEGATNCYYKPSRADNAESYYCVITSDDGINNATITTKATANVPEYKDADYSEFYALYEEYEQIDKSIYKDGEFDEVDELFQTDITQYSLAEQDTIDELVAKIRDLIASAEFNYVLFDVNADSKISIVDARLTLKAVVGSYTLDKTQTLAADVNGDGEVSIADSRAILKSVLEQ